MTSGYSSNSMSFPKQSSNSIPTSEVSVRAFGNFPSFKSKFWKSTTYILKRNSSCKNAFQLSVQVPHEIVKKRFKCISYLKIDIGVVRKTVLWNTKQYILIICWFKIAPDWTDRKLWANISGNDNHFKWHKAVNRSSQVCKFLF